MKANAKKKASQGECPDQDRSQKGNKVEGPRAPGSKKE